MIRVGTKVRDTVTSSVWTVVKMNQKSDDTRHRWHLLQSPSGAHRRITTSELEDRYVKVAG